MRKIKKLPPQKELQKLFDYDSDTGIVRRKVSKPNAKVGTIVGTPQNSGYLAVSIHSKTYLLHRVAWTLANGDIAKGLIIDHINGDKSDNRIENLRAVPEIENNKNQKRSIKNTSGCTGVYYKKERKVWSAEITVDRKKINLGQYKKKENAIAARKKAELVYRYHPNHDRELPISGISEDTYITNIITLVDKEGLLDKLKVKIKEYEKTNNTF